MNVLIVEDELLMAKQLTKMVQQLEPDAQIMAVSQSVEETCTWLRHHPSPDLIFMDIELGDGQSFKIFEAVTVSSPVIFTTAYDEFAIKAFKVNSVDYLLKPIKEEELRGALTKFHRSNPGSATMVNIQQLLDAVEAMHGPAHLRNRFLVKIGQRFSTIYAHEVAYLVSVNGHTFLHTHDNQKYILDHKLDELERSLSPKEFFRANRQYIISPRSVVAVHSWINQKLRVSIQPAGHEDVIVSRDKAGTFKIWLGE